MWVFWQTALNRRLNTPFPGDVHTDLGAIINKVHVVPLQSGIKIIQEWVWMWDLVGSATSVSLYVLQLSPSSNIYLNVSQCLLSLPATNVSATFLNQSATACNLGPVKTLSSTGGEWKPCSFSPSPTPFCDSLSLFSHTWKELLSWVTVWLPSQAELRRATMKTQFALDNLACVTLRNL